MDTQASSVKVDARRVWALLSAEGLAKSSAVPDCRLHAMQRLVGRVQLASLPGLALKGN